MVDTDKIFVTRNIFGVSQTMALDILNFFDGIEHTTGLFQKIQFYIVYGKMFFSLIYFLVIKDYEFPKSTSHILSVLLNLKFIRILT